MKKLISLLLGLALLAAVSVPVLADDAQTAFDPHVTVNTTSSRITVTVNDIPAGQTPSLTVDCSFSSASVTGPDGAIDKGKVTLAEGKITFPVAKGGTYTITNTAPPPPAAAPRSPPMTSPSATLPTAPSSPTEATWAQAPELR